MSKSKFTSRTRARKRAVDVVFEADQKGFGHIPHLLRDLLEERTELSPAQAPMNDFSQTLVEGVADHIDEIDDWIIRFLRNTTLERLPATDRAILRVATWEILYNTEIDAPVVMKEAIILAEAIGGTDNSPAFMNAILANISHHAHEEALFHEEALLHEEPLLHEELPPHDDGEPGEVDNPGEVDDPGRPMNLA